MIGFKINYDNETVNKLAKLQMKLQDCCRAKEYEEKIAKLDDEDFFVKQDLQEIASILSISDEENQKRIQTTAKITNRKIICQISFI